MSWALAIVAVLALGGMVAVALNDHGRHRRRDKAARAVAEHLTFTEVPRDR